MGLFWDDPSWNWDNIILWDQAPTTALSGYWDDPEWIWDGPIFWDQSLGFVGGTQAFPYPDKTGARVPRRKKHRAIYFSCIAWLIGL